jgi:hypothetical protein
MRSRIALWGAAGFLVAAWWAVYIYVRAPEVPIRYQAFTWMLVRITCPIAFLSSYPIPYYAALLANAATYALIGLIVEMLRLRLHRQEHAH